MMEIKATANQLNLLDELSQKLRIEFDSDLNKAEADSLIKKMLGQINGKPNGSNHKAQEKQDLINDYPIAFQAFVYAACDFYKGSRDKSFKDIFNEVKSVF